MKTNPNLELLATGLETIVGNIRAGNSNATEDELIDLCGMISLITHPESKRSKYQAANHLKVSRATFDNYVSKGLITKGRSQQGFKEIFWYNQDLWKLKRQIRWQGVIQMQ